jgi:hypothetical protein
MLYVKSYKYVYGSVCGIKTKHTCRFGESGVGDAPRVRPIRDSPPCKYVCYRIYSEYAKF